MADRPAYVLDACSVMNLYATRRMAAILACLETDVFVASIVLAESQYVLTGGDGEETSEPEPIDLTGQIEQGVLHVTTFQHDEERLAFIDLASRLDDGEAMTIALAMTRGWIVVTEDRKAERLADELSIPCLSSLDMIRQWADQERLDAPTLRSILLDVRRRARWEPRRNHPHRLWWDDILG